MNADFGISSHLTLPVALETDTASRNQSLRGPGFGFAIRIACVKGILIVGLEDSVYVGTWRIPLLLDPTHSTPFPPWTCYLVLVWQCVLVFILGLISPRGGRRGGDGGD